MPDVKVVTDKPAPDLPPDIPLPDLPVPDQIIPDIPLPDLPPPDLPKPDAGPVVNPVKGACIKGGWCWLHPLPQGHSLRGVWAFSATEAFAVGEHGTFLRLSSGKWQAVDCGTLKHLNAVWGSSASDVWAVGVYGTVVNFDGKNCTAIPSGTSADLYGVYGHSASAAWAVGAKGVVLFSAGMGFASLSYCGSSSTTLRAVWSAGATDPWVVGHKGKVHKLSGTTCTAVTVATTDDLYALWGSNATNIYAVGKQGTVLHYTKSWKESQISNDDLYALWGTGPTDVFAAGKGGVVYHLGATWQSEKSPTKVNIKALHGAGKAVLAVGDYGTMLRRNTGGWKQTSTASTSNSLYSIHGNSPTDMVAVGFYGAALHFDGKTWSAGNTGTTTHNLYDVWSGGAGTHWAVGYYQKAGHYATMKHFNGTAWSGIPLPVPYNYVIMRGIWGTGNTLFAVGYNYKKPQDVVILEGNGKTWTQVKPNYATIPNAVWGTSATNVYLVGGASMHRDAKGWTPIYPTTGYCDYFNDVWGTGPNTVFFGGYRAHNKGCVMKLSNGKFWKGQTLGGTVKALWGTSGTAPYAVGNKGVVYRYDGAIWKAEEIGTGIDLMDIWGTSATNVFIVGSYGAILHRDQ